jgi:hypothetical protein
MQGGLSYQNCVALAALTNSYPDAELGDVS